MLDTLWTELLPMTTKFFFMNASVYAGNQANHAIEKAEKIGPYSLVQLAYQGKLLLQNIPCQQDLIQAHRIGQIDAITLMQGAIEAGGVPVSAITDSAYLNAIETSFLLHYWLHVAEPNLRMG